MKLNKTVHWCLLLFICIPAESSQIVDFLDDFESGSFGSWQFTGSTNSQQSGDAGVCPGNWYSSITPNALEGNYSAELFAQSTAKCAPWNVVASIETTVSSAPRFGARLQFDAIAGSGGIGHSFFDIVIINASNVAEFYRYRFSTTADLGGDEQIAVSPGDELHFVRNIGNDFLAKYGQPLPDDIILQFRVSADYAEGGTGTRTTHVRLDSVILVDNNPYCPDADLNNDCNVDFLDATIMMDGWLGGGPLADIWPTTPDDWVDNFDFSLLASQWASSGIVAPLAPGMNLVSVPVRGNTTSLPDLLASIAGKYRSVFSYDRQNAINPWESFAPDRPIYLDALPRIDVNQGFWIDMTEAAELAIPGSSLDGTEYPIRVGWNLISYPSTSSQAIGTAVADVADIIEIVQEYDAANAGSEWTSYATANPGSATLTTLRPGFGYWVKATADDLWSWQQDRYLRKYSDVLVTHVLANPVAPMLLPGQTQKNVTLTIGISNTEKISASQVRVQVFDDTTGSPVLLKDTTLPLIAPEYLEEFTVINTFSGGVHPLRVVVDPADTLTEEDETNNEFAYGLTVLNAVSATAGMNPQSGEVPIKIDFSGSAANGVPPYVHAWLRQEDGALFQGPTVSLIYSTTGNKQMTYLVSDSLTKGPFSFGASDTLNFSLSSNTLGTPANFGIDIYDVNPVPGSDSDVDVLINISNP